MGVKKGQLDVSKAITGSDKLSDTLGQVSDKLETLTSALKDVQEKSSKKINFQADMSDLEKAEAVLQRFKISIDDLKKEEALPILKKLKDMQDDKSIKGVSVKNAQGVFTTVDDAQKQMIDAWNTLMESRPGGVSQLSDLVSSGDKNATAVLRWANAFEALGGDIAEVNPIINDFIQKMRSLDVFSSDKGYTYGVENLKKIFEQFKELQKLGASFKKFNDTVTQMPEIKPLKIFGSDNTEEYEEETDRIEKSTERQKKALLSLEEIKQRLAAKRREKTNFYSDNDLNSIFGFDDDFEDSDNLIQTYSKVLKRLQDKRDEELEDVEYWQNAHARAYNVGDDSRASQYFGYMEESIKQYYQYADAIEYVQGRLQEATLNFKPGESWGANEIQATITLLQKLAEQLDIISTKFTKIDSIEGFQSLINDIGSISTDINNLGKLFNDVFAAFDENGKIISMTSQLQSLVETVRQLGDSLKDAKFNINIGSGGSIGQIAARQSITSIEAIQKYKRAYEELLDLLSSDGNSLSIFKGNDKLFKQFFEANELIGGESKTSQLQGYKIAIEALKQASSIKGIDLSQWIDEFEKVAIAADQAYEKVIMGNSTEDIAQKLFGGGGNISVEDFKTMSDQIKELKNTVLSISQILSDVFSPILDTIKDKFQEESTKFTSVGEAVGFITQKIEEKNSKIREEAEAVESASGVEVEYFQAIEFAVEAIVQQLNNLLAVLPSIKFDEFIGSESASKLGEFVSNLTELSRILDTIDDKDVFHHLNDILQAPGENFSNNLQKIKNGFNDLKTVMNGFNDNGSAVFKSLSDIATAGDAVIEKMQKLFEQSGVKLPLAEQEIVGTPVNVNGSNSASRKRVNIKIQENNGAQKRLEDNLQAIRDLGKANTMKNLVEAKGAAGKASVDELVDSLQKVREAAEKAEIAIGDLYQMKKEGLISQEDLDRYLELYESDEIVNGTLQSQSKAQLAIETQREKQVRESDKAIKQLSDSYIELAQAEEKAANASTEADRELGRRQVDAIKIKQKELREQVGKLIGSERLKTVETFAQADADEYKRLLSEKRSGKISTSINDLGFSDTDNVEKTWDTLISKASRYQAILYKEKSGKTLTATEAEFLQKLKPLYDEAGNHAEQAGEKYNQLNDALKKSQDNIKESILGQYEQSIGGLTDNDIKKPDAYNEQVKKLKTNLEELKKVQFGSDDWFNRINLLDEGLKKLNSDASMKSVKQSSIETLDRKMAEWINSNSAAGEFRVQVEQLRDSLSNVRSKEEFNGIVSDFERVKAAAADAGKTGQSFGEGLIKRFKSLGQYLLSFASFYRIIGTIKRAVSIVTELNDALTEMRKVSSESLSTLEKFQFKTFDLADQVGTNAVAVQKSTAAWLRLGKDFNEAQQAAVDSTKLLNTTEIENIDDATSSLLSITQAYREITREDAIDKINNIGDHFSSSSSDLAQGLKNVSAVLKTQGNDIDQALALLTAGNDITQDISKASMGVRTIALRISGTEEAKNEIQDMGEDIDDFVVRTKSKTDKIIRDYTAVASNAYKGISVLDENGNLRSTYDILLDISRVYKEIQEEDKKRGTNRAAALVEELAGKTRSQIASSILLNPELLEEAYVAAQNSEGVGQMELDRYLDSISAKVQQLQNRIQELAFTAIDSDFVKTIVDGLSSAVQLATKLVDIFGTFPALFGTAGAVIAQSAGFGLFANKKGNGGLVNYFKNFTSSIKIPETVTRNFVRPFSLGLEDALSGMADDADPTILFYDMFGRPESGFNNWVNGLSDSDEVKNALLNMKEGTTTVGELRQELTQLNTVTTQVRTPIAGLGSAFSGVVSIGKQLVSTIGTMLIFTAVSLAVQELVKWIYSLVTAQERAIEAGKEAQNRIQDTINGYNNTKKTISELRDEYAKLSTGVKSTDNFVENVSLSDDEFQRYLEISAQLAELSPELVTGYNNQGTAIVNLGNTVESVNNEFDKYLKLQRDIANTDISGNLDAVFKGALKSEEKYNAKLEELRQKAENLSSQNSYERFGNDNDKLVASSTRLENGNGELVDLISVNDGVYDIVIPNYESDKWVKKIQKLGAGWDKFDNGDNTITIQIDTDDLDEAQVRALNGMYSGTSASGQKEEIFTQAEIRKYELLIANAYKEVVPTIKDYIETTPFFDDIGTEAFQDKLRSGMINMFSNMDYQSLSDEIQQIGGFEYFVDDIISSMLATEDTQNAFVGLSDLANKQGEMTYSEIIKARDSFYEKIIEAFSDGEGGSLFTADQLNLLFGYSSKGEDDTISSIFEERVSTAEQKLKLGEDKLFDLLNETKYANAESALKAIEQMSQKDAEKIAGNYEEIFKFLEPYLTGEKTKAKPIYDDTLATLFGDEEYSKSASKFESNLSSISQAMETLRTEGELTAEQMTELQETFPDFFQSEEDFSYEKLSSLSADELGNWIGEIRKAMETMSPVGQSAAQTYIDNLIKSMSDLKVSAQDARKEVYTSLVTSDDDVIAMRQGRKANDIIGALQSHYGEDLDWNIVWQLAVNDQLSGPVNDIYQRYDALKISWDLEVGDIEIQNAIDKLTSDRELRNAEKSYTEALGKTVGREYFENDIQISEGLIEQYNNQLDQLDAEWRSLPESDKINEQIKNAYEKRRVQILQSIYNEQGNIEADEDQITLAPMVAREQYLQSLQAEADALQRDIDATESRGKEVSAEQYQRMIDNAERQRYQNEQLQQLYSEAAQKEFEENGVTQDYLDWTEKANGYADAIANLDASMLQWANNIQNINLTHLENEMNDLQRQAENLTHDLNEASDSQKVVINVELQLNADEQLRNLKEQRAEILANFLKKNAEERKRQKEAGEEVTGFTENDPEMVQLRNALAENDSQVQAVLDSKQEYLKSAMSLPIDVINKVMDKKKTDLQQMQNEVALKEARGDAKEVSDYNEEIKATSDLAVGNRFNSFLSSVKARIYEEKGMAESAEQAWADADQYDAEYMSNLAEASRLSQERNDVRRQAIIDELQSQRDINNSEKQYLEELGQSVGREYYENDIAISEGLIEQYNADLKYWESIYESTQKGERATAEYMKKRAEIMANIQAEQINIHNDEMQETMLPMLGREQYLQSIQLAGEALQHDVDAAVNRGQEVTAEQYQGLIKNAEEQKYQREQLQKLYSDAAQEALNNKDINGYLELSSKANENAEAIVNLDANMMQWADDAQNIDLTHLQNEMTALQSEADRLTNSLTDASNGEKAIIYVRLGINADAEQANLEAQRADIVKQFNEDNDAERERQRLAGEQITGFTYDSTRYQTYLSDLRDIDSQLVSLTNNQREWTNELLNIPLDVIDDALTEQSNKLQRLQDNIALKEAKGYKKTEQDYEDEAQIYFQTAAENAVKTGLSNARAAILEGLGFRDLAKEERQNTETYKSDRKQAEANAYNSRREGKNVYVQNLQDDLTELEQAASRYQDIMSEIEATGNRVTADQYQNLIGNADEQISIYDDMIANREELLKTANETDALTYRQEIAGWQSSRAGLKQNKVDWHLKEQEAILNDALSGYEKLQVEQQEVQNQIDAAEAAGLHGTQAQYSRLAENAKSQIENLEEQKTLWQSIADKRAVEFGTDSTYYTDALKQVQDLASQQNDLQAQYIQNLTQPYVDQIDDLGEKYSDLQSEQSAIQDKLELREKKGYKTTARDYKRLLKNAKDQKKNIEEQNALLRKQRKAIQDAGGDWSDVQDQIESNNESIRGLNSSIFDYEQSIRTAALTEAQALASAIQTAMQEMASETGLSTDTILQLKQAFSDLKSMDISTLFYRTADGIKMSVNTLNTLIEAENTLKNNELDEQIRAQQEAMEKEAEANGTLTFAYRKMEDELLNLMNIRSQYFATYQEQLAAIDGHSLIELAKSTKNPLDRYNQSREYLKEAYEMYEKGQIGSDDFKAIASYFDVNGFSDEATFKANYDKYSKYFTEDATGLVAFWDKLVASGVAAKDELGNYILTMGDVEKAAEAANIPLAVFQDIIMATNDYGADVAFVTSVQDGREQLAGLNKELRDEQVKLEQLKASGAEQSVIDKQAEVVKNVENSITNLQSATDAAVYSERRSFLEGAKGAKQLWEAYSGYRDDAINDGDIEARRFWEQMMRTLAEEYDLEIKPGFEFDQEGYDELMAEVQKEMNNTEELKIRFSVSDEDVTSAKNALDKAFNGNRQNIYEATSELRKYSAEELLAIDHADRIWSDGEKEVEEFAEALGLPLDKINALIIALKEMGMLTSDLGSEQVEEVASQPVYVNSGVNLRNRPQVSANKMRNMGYNVEEGSYATVFSSAYSNEDETKTVVVTPILPNGDILRQGTLEKFAGELLEGNEISVPQVELAMFQGEDSVEQAQRYSDVLHGVQEAFYDNDLAFQALLSTINANQGGLDKVIFGDGDVAEGAEALEGALDGVLEQLGLGQEYGQALLYVLAQMGFIEMPELTTEVDVDTEGAKTEVKNLDKELSEEKIEKEIVYKTNQEEIKMYTDNPLNEEFEYEGNKPGPSSEKRRQIQVNVIRNKVDEKMAENGYTAQDILTNWSDQDIALNFQVNGADEIKMVKEYVTEIEQTDGYDLTVHIDETQMTSLLEALNPENPIEVEVDDDPWNEFVKEVEDTDLTVTIKTKLETPTDTTTGSTSTGSSSTGNKNNNGSSNAGKSGNQGYKPSGDIIDNKSAQSSINDINSMLNSLDVGKTYITIDGGMAIKQINDFNNRISKLDVGRTYITIDGTQAINQINEFNSLITTGLEHGETNINVDTTLAKQVIEDFNNSIDSVHDGKSIISVNTSQAIKKINSFNATIGSIPNGSASVSVSGVTLATSQVNNLIRQLNELNGKRSTYTVTRVNQVSNGGDGGLRTPSALGTAHALGGAFAFGNAYASGQNWGVPDNEDALVNEVGQESIVIFCDDIR